MGTQLTITRLMDEISKGQLILPEFQRGYVWTDKQVREYLGSLYKGYPTGSFLIWKTPNPGATRGSSGDSDGSVFQLILDGQQRLTSVYALATGAPPPFYEGEKLTSTCTSTSQRKNSRTSRKPLCQVLKSGYRLHPS